MKFKILIAMAILIGSEPKVLASNFVLAPFSESEKATALALGSAAIASSLLLKAPEGQPHWEGVLPGDLWIKDGLGFGTAQGSRVMGQISNWTVAGLIATPTLFPGPAGGPGRWQALQSFSATGLASDSLKVLAGRARPYVSQCRDNALEQDCTTRYRNESFPSGHTAFAFTGAGLMCSLRSDALCPIGLGFAVATGGFRIAANQHYLSDVLAGAAIGWVSGFYLPRWRSGGPTVSGVSAGYQVAIALP